MGKFNFRKLVFINILIVFVLLLSGINRNTALADEGCNAAQVVDYLVELTNLGVLEDNSFEGKKKGLNKFGIEGLEYLASPEEKVTVEKLSSICVAVMKRLGENEEIAERDIIKKLGRINDLEKADIIHTENLITTLEKGIIIGKSLGKYSQKRNIEPKRRVSLNEVKKVMDRVYNTDKRYPMSPDGQLIRKTNLPVNASEYKYILAAFPNSFYETRFSYEMIASTYQTLHTHYDPPKFTYERVKNGYISYNNIYEEADKIRRFQDHRFNVDYRTIDKDWGKKLVSFYRVPRDDESFLKGIKNEIKKYIKFVKDNKVIIEAKPSSAEASAAYYDFYNLYFHEHMKFRIVSCKNFDKNLGKIIYGVLFSNEPYGISRNYKEKVELGKWIEGVYSIKYPKRLLNPLSSDYFPWKWAGMKIMDNTKRNIRKTRVLKQFKITPKDKLWYNPETTYPFYGWD